jgi:hypothetical protein
MVHADLKPALMATVDADFAAVEATTWLALRHTAVIQLLNAACIVTLQVTRFVLTSSLR